MALSDIYRATLRIRVDDKVTSINQHYFAVSGVGTLDGVDKFIEEYVQRLYPSWQTILAEDATLEGLTIRCLQPGFAKPGNYFNVSTFGLRPGNAAPANQCLVLTLQHGDQTAVRQGRIYVSGCSKADMLEGAWSPDFIEDQVVPHCEQLRADVVEGGATFRPIVLQQVQGGIEIEPVPLTLTGIRANPTCYSQSRRTTRQHAFGPLFVP